jgi:hypothetical protein
MAIEVNRRYLRAKEGNAYKLGQGKVVGSLIIAVFGFDDLH